MTRPRIALATLRPPVSPADSLALAIEGVRAAGSAGADIVCFPECFVPGYRMPGASAGRPDAAFLEHAHREIASTAAAEHVAAILGTERFIDGELRATALVINERGEPLGFQDKVQIDPSEEGTYSPGSGRRVFSAAGLTFGIAICHEGWRYPETVRWAARRGAQIVFHPHFHPPELGGYRPRTFADPANSFHETAMRCRAAENTVYFASVNCAIDGAPTTSAVIRPDGSVLTYQPYGVEGLLVADLALEEATGLLAKRWRACGQEH